MESITHWRETDERRGLAFALGCTSMVLCDQRNDQNDYIVANNLCTESVAIFRELRDTWGIAYSLFLLARVPFTSGDYTTAGPIYEESLAVWRTLNDPWGLALPLNRLGEIACKRGDYDTARALLEESLAIRQQVGQKFLIAHSLNSLADVALRQGDYRSATAYMVETLPLYQELGRIVGIAGILVRFAQVTVGQAQMERAAQLLGAAEAKCEEVGIPLPPEDRATYERVVDRVQTALGEAMFTVAWAEGQAMTLEQAVAYALAGSEVDSASAFVTAAPQ